VVAHQPNYDKARRRELADFLRQKREGLAPRAVSSRQRRLTPGLRREEVAELAGIGTTWYTWLEQARDIRPSDRTLRRIARALQLDKLETKYLLDLGLEHAPRPPTTQQVPREVMAVVNGMIFPALVVGRSSELLAFNLAANALWDLDYAPDGNFLRSLFTPEMRAFIVNWEEFTRQHVAVFRRRSASVLGDPAVVGVIDELTERSPEFRRWWSERKLPTVSVFRYLCNYPFAGRLEFEYSCYGVLEFPDLVTIALATERAHIRRRLADLINQVEQGEHDEQRNIWMVLASHRLQPPREDQNREYQ
jgi:transcriptional regulator with XRE-family HTH domain